MATTTQLGSYGHYTLSNAPADDVRNVVGEFADDYDLAVLTADYIAAINTALHGTGITLHGSEFIGTYPARADAGTLIRSAIESVDLGALIEQYDTTEDDFEVVCANGCPDGAQGRHKFSCPLAGQGGA